MGFVEALPGAGDPERVHRSDVHQTPAVPSGGSGDVGRAVAIDPHRFVQVPPTDMDQAGGMDHGIRPPHGLVDRTSIAQLALHRLDIDAGKDIRVWRLANEGQTLVAEFMELANDIVPQQTGTTGNEHKHESRGATRKKRRWPAPDAAIRLAIVTDHRESREAVRDGSQPFIAAAYRSWTASQSITLKKAST